MKILPIQLPREKIHEFCQRWQVQELDLFGSVLREDFRPDSDVDVLVEFQPEARRNLLDLVQMEQELAEMFGREVDLLSKSAIEKSPNWLRRQAILSTAEPVYVAG
ncbi:nucleotidyltransferase family protein [Synechococcus sp. PCC 7336]|uniref:nucleotidyltransferase family protein n=1 Tax=Synechococcus sp. PCC 7336 TaxID=195250 RepID=UPI000367EE2E|nr:nucleotidyltransferase family protein [Synechococcus sp. PCC 7336]